MNKILGALAMAVLLFSSSCTRSRNITATPTPATTTAVDNLAELRQAVDKANPQYNWLRINGSVEVAEGEDRQPSANLSLRMRQDSLIWSRVSLFIQVAQARVTKDSAVLVNYIGKNYSQFPVSDLKNLLAMDDIGLSSVQRILIAVPPFPIQKDARLTQTDNTYQLSYSGNAYREDITFDKASMRMTHYRYERNASQFIDITYSDFRQVDGKSLPHKMEAQMQAPEKYSLTLNVEEYKFQPADEAPFKIPASFTRQ